MFRVPERVTDNTVTSLSRSTDRERGVHGSWWLADALRGRRMAERVLRVRHRGTGVVRRVPGGLLQ